MMAISNEELIAKAREAKSAEELLALAKENNVELTEEEAKAYFEQMNKTGELADDELDSVAGGGCHKKDGRLVVALFYNCKDWVCQYCGKPETNRSWHSCKHRVDGLSLSIDCVNCKQHSYEKGLLLCNNPNNRK